MDNRAKQAAFKARMREKGLAQVTEWIPVTARNQLKGLAEKLRKGEAVTTDKVTSNQATTTASVDWLQPLADRAAFHERVKRAYCYSDLISLAVADVMNDPISTDDALDELANTLCDALEGLEDEFTYGLDEALDTLVGAIRREQEQREEYRQEQAAQDALPADLETAKGMVAKVEAAANGPRKYAAFNGCVNDCGQVHVGNSQLGIVDLELYRWRAIYQQEDIASGRLEKASKPMGAYLVTKAVLEHYE